MTKKCPKCEHIFLADEPHECPTIPYLLAREALIKGAIETDPGEDNEPKQKRKK